MSTLLDWLVTWTMLGYAGDALFVLAHFLLSTKRLTMGRAYQWMQICAALMLGASAYMSSFYPTTVLELIWICISLFSIRQMRREQAARKA